MRKKRTEVDLDNYNDRYHGEDLSVEGKSKYEIICMLRDRLCENKIFTFSKEIVKEICNCPDDLEFHTKIVNKYLKYTK